MASNSNGSDAIKKGKSTTNENNYNKTFSNQKNQKSRSLKSSNEKATTTITTMEINSNSNSKGSLESSEKNTSLSSALDEGRCLVMSLKFI